MYFRRDIDLLIHYLERAYPARFTMQPQAWNTILSQLNQINVPDNIRAQDFGTIIADILWQIPDGHLIVRHGSTKLGKLLAQNMRRPTTGPNMAGEKVWMLQEIFYKGKAVPLLSIFTFPQASDPVWNDLFKHLEQFTRASVLIVDLRGNEGGDDTVANQLTSFLLGYEMPTDWIEELECRSPEAYELQINTYRGLVVRYEQKGQPVPATLNDKIEDLTRMMISGIRQEKLIQHPSTARAHGTRFKGEIIVLVDAATKSSGEWAALYLKQHPNTKLVGENTYGMIHFGNTGHLTLPNSGLELHLCMKINRLTDGSFYEKTGIPPDIRISNRDSLQHLLSLR